MPETPAWKSDFPIDWVDDHFVSRRELTKSLVWVSCASFVTTAALAARAAFSATAQALPARKVARIDELAIGGAKVFGYPAEHQPCLLLRLSAERFVAFAQRCTHLGCPVTFEAAQGTLHCPCHEGYFSADDGRVLAGPPPRPLPRVELETRGDELWAVGVRL